MHAVRNSMQPRDNKHGRVSVRRTKLARCNTIALQTTITVTPDGKLFFSRTSRDLTLPLKMNGRTSDLLSNAIDR